MNKKGIMGIGTLIIFIATILVAAVAAGVIISTSGVLQQKALLVGEQSQNRLVNGIQITHVFMTGNILNKTANNIEILARPEPASGPVNLKTTSVSFFTNTGAYSASLSHPNVINLEYTPSAAIDSTFQAFGDLDGDGIDEEIRLVTDSGSGNDYLEVNVSTYENTSDQINIGFDADAGSLSVNKTDLPIAINNTIVGYVHIDDASTTSSQLDAGTVTITDHFRGECTFAKLIPEKYYCIVTLNGIDDTSLEYGETVLMYFKLKTPLQENDEFEVKIFPQDGRSTFVLDRVPQVIYKTRMGVFP